MLDRSLKKFAGRTAYKFMGASISFADVDEQSRAFAAHLQSLGLQKGDRVAVMMPNVPQYPVAMAGILRAGLVIVNVNPLYTARELEHQLSDSGAKAVVVLENFAATLQQVIEGSPARKMHVVLASIGDSLSFVKGSIVNFVVRHVRKLVPAYSIPGAVRFPDALSSGAGKTFVAPEVIADDLALLQYTGGTTGVSKGAMLLHRNIVANLLQCEAWNYPALKQLPDGETFTVICALPLYHIFGFTANMMLGLHLGGCNILIPNARDVGSMLKAIQGETFHSFPAVNTLFNGVLNHADFDKVNWKNLKLSVGGGMAVTQGTARAWIEKTGCTICEGYGLSETSPTATCNRVDRPGVIGSIGLPLPDTELALLDDDGMEVGEGVAGEIAIRGPQVMAGYWGAPEETARVMTPDGFFRTGDIGTVDARGYFKIVDRKKDMVLVSGFKVFPNEVEDAVSTLAGVLECAVYGVPDARSGEAVKLVVVKKDPALSIAAIAKHCEENLAAYKRPKLIEFRDDLPKSPVGKVLRRLLRDEKMQKKV